MTLCDHQRIAVHIPDRPSIYTMNYPQGRIVETAITSNGRAGIDISGGADPSVVQCTITEGRGPGIVVRQVRPRGPSPGVLD